MGGTYVVSDPLLVERQPDGKRKVKREFTVCVEGEEIKVDKGFVMDYSSLPRGTRWVVHWTKVDVAGVIHDWLYQYGEVECRRRAEWIWWKIAQKGCHRANWLQAGLCWLGMRIGSWPFWNCYAPRRDEYRKSRKMTQKVGRKCCSESGVVKVIIGIAMAIVVLQFYSCKFELSVGGDEWKFATIVCEVD